MPHSDQDAPYQQHNSASNFDLVGQRPTGPAPHVSARLIAQLRYRKCWPHIRVPAGKTESHQCAAQQYEKRRFVHLLVTSLPSLLATA